MNPIVISAIIASGSFILTIFGAIYLNQRHVDKLMEQMDKRLEEMDKRFEARINESSYRVEGKIDVLRSEMQAHRMESNVRSDSLQKEVVGLQTKVERIDQALFRPVLPPRG